MRMIRLLPALAASVLLSSAAAFADPAMTGDWSGFYIGGVGGAEFGNAHFSLPGDKHDALQSSHGNNTNFNGGGLAGFNFQSNNFVYGIEGEVTDGDGTRSVTACAEPDGCFTSAHDSFTTFNHLKTGISEKLRARFGLAYGDTLFYAAAGYSHADTKLSLVGDCYDFADPAVPTVYNFARSRQVSGINLGVGVEYALGSFFVRGEYVFDDYGSGTWKGDGAEWNDRRISLNDNLVRAAVGLHL
jgi:outer membrane immunogenic protein